MTRTWPDPGAVIIPPRPPSVSQPLSPEERLVFAAARRAEDAGDFASALVGYLRVEATNPRAGLTMLIARQQLQLGLAVEAAANARTSARDAADLPLQQQQMIVRESERIVAEATARTAELTIVYDASSEPYPRRFAIDGRKVETQTITLSAGGHELQLYVEESAEPRIARCIERRIEVVGQDSLEIRVGAREINVLRVVK